MASVFLRLRRRARMRVSRPFQMHFACRWSRTGWMRNWATWTGPELTLVRRYRILRQAQPLLAGPP